MKALLSIFSRAASQKYLAPWERSLYRFALALVVLIPSSLLLAGIASLLASLHAGAPDWLWQILAVLIPAVLLAAAKYYTAHGDAALGTLLQQIEQGAEGDLKQ